MLERTLATTLRKAVRTFPAVLLTGARQTGKTTLLRRVFGHSHRYVSLENPDVRLRAQEDPRGFLSENPAPVILDEIQYVPSLLSYIKSAIDEDRVAGRWLLTSSQSLALMSNVSQSLAGRVAVMRLMPLSVGESRGVPAGDATTDGIIERAFGAALPVDSNAVAQLDLADWILRGGYPELRHHPQVDRQLWCASYVQTYLERDVRMLAGVNDLHTFQRFVRLCAARTAQLLNVTDLARDAGVSPPTARRWLSILEASMLIVLLPPFFRNIGKRLVKSPKLYFTDTAIASWLVGLHAAEATMHGPMGGALAETAVVVEWLKVFHHRGETPSMHFFRSRSGLEADLLIERNARLYAAEVKATQTPSPKHVDNLVKLGRLLELAPHPTLFADIRDARALRPGIVARGLDAIG